MSYDPAFWNQVQFAFTLTYHYLFPQVTVGLGIFPSFTCNRMCFLCARSPRKRDHFP
jgi:hypothetical protein